MRRSRAARPENRGPGEAARVIRQQHPEMAILVLSAHAEVDHGMELLASGRSVGHLLNSRVMDVGDFLDTGPGRQGRVAGLSPREREVLALMAEGRSNAGIGRRLWVSEGTVEK